MSRRKRRRPPWPVQLVGTAAALALAALVIAGGAILLGVRR